MDSAAGPTVAHQPSLAAASPCMRTGALPTVCMRTAATLSRSPQQVCAASPFLLPTSTASVTSSFSVVLHRLRSLAVVALDCIPSLDRDAFKICISVQDVAVAALPALLAPSPTPLHGLAAILLWPWLPLVALIGFGPVGDECKISDGGLN